MRNDGSPNHQRGSRQIGVTQHRHGDQVLLFIILTLIFTSRLSQGYAEDRVLFAFDDHSIPWRHNLKVTLV